MRNNAVVVSRWLAIVAQAAVGTLQTFAALGDRKGIIIVFFEGLTDGTALPTMYDYDGQITHLIRRKLLLIPGLYKATLKHKLNIP